MSPAGFYLFPGLKLALKGQCICDATDIIKNTTEELKRLSKMASRNVSNTCIVCSRSIYLVAQGDYFERNVVAMIVVFVVFLTNEVIPRTF
jgi:hypothetical protein